MSNYNKEEYRQIRIEAKATRRERKRIAKQLRKSRFRDGCESSEIIDRMFQNEQKQKVLKRRRMFLLITTYSKISFN